MLTLTPFSARIHWRFQGALAEAPWPELACAFIDAVASEVTSHHAVIGHIKGIACCGAHTLRVNCVSARLPADLQGDLPPGTPEMLLELAVLAYGLPWSIANSSVELAMEEAGKAYNCHGQMQPSPNTHSHNHQ